MLKKNFSWSMVSERRFHIISYIIFLAVLIIFKPPMYLTLPVIILYITIKSFINQQTITQWFKTLIVLSLIISAFYLISHYLGGIWSIIIIHLLGCGFIIYANKELILKANTEIQTHARHIALKQRRYKEWKKKQ